MLVRRLRLQRRELLRPPRLFLGGKDPFERLKAAFPQFTLPLFIIHGTLDKATKPSGSQLFYDTAGSPDKTLKLYDGYFHDMLNDVGKEAVMRDITAWIDARVGK